MSQVVIIFAYPAVFFGIVGQDEYEIMIFIGVKRIGIQCEFTAEKAVSFGSDTAGVIYESLEKLFRGKLRWRLFNAFDGSDKSRLTEIENRCNTQIIADKDMLL